MVQKISIYKDFSSDLREVWENLTSDKDSSPFLKFFLHESWYDLFGELDSLCVINHSDSVLMPLILNDKYAEFTGGQDLFDYHDFIFKKEVIYGRLFPENLFSFRRFRRSYLSL